MAALCVWVMILAREGKRILRFAFGVAQIPLGKHTDIVRKPGPEKCWEIITLGRMHCAFIWSLTCLRIGSAVILGYAGTLFIVHEINMKDLLLNCAALEIVLTLDSLVFEVLAPERFIREYVEKTEPLTFKKTRRVNFIMNSAITLGLVMAVFFGFASLFLFWQDLEIVKWTMCGGEQNFVFALDAMDVAHVRTTTEYRENSESSAKTFIDHLQGTFHDYVQGDLLETNWFNVDFEANHKNYSSEAFWEEVRGSRKWAFDHRFEKFLFDRSDAATYPSGEYSIWHCLQTGVSNGSNFELALDSCSLLQHNLTGYCKTYAHLCHTFPALTISCPKTCGCDSPYTRPSVPGMILPGDAIHVCPGALHHIPRDEWDEMTYQCADFPVSPSYGVKLRAYRLLKNIVTYPNGSHVHEREVAEAQLTVKDLDLLPKTMILRFLFPSLPYGKNFAAQVHTLSVFLEKNHATLYKQLLAEPKFESPYGSDLSWSKKEEDSENSADEPMICTGYGWHFAGNKQKNMAQLSSRKRCDESSLADLTSLKVFFNETIFVDALTDVPLCYLPFLFPEWCLWSTLSSWCPDACDCARLGHLSNACRLIEKSVMQPGARNASSTWLCDDRDIGARPWPSSREVEKSLEDGKSTLASNALLSLPYPSRVQGANEFRGYRCPGESGAQVQEDSYAQASVWCDPAESTACWLSEYIDIPFMDMPPENNQRIQALQSNDGCRKP
eukprot:TRINITY_DN29988_c0_g1_i3.p1 TRINITY_DN29988_c0_g1~~TRINITY_DN29988_c0_g1_i3.p1  ORF type:complete len:725 (-),score=93.95 TRINITY_DN29988_c0_g1_i3:267-2441(-)